MKYKLDQKYKNFFLLGTGLILLTLFLLNLSSVGKALRGILSVISPFLGGFAAAYILNRPVMLLENKLSRCTIFKNKTVLRIFSVILVLLLLFLLLAGLCYIILPQLVRNLLTLFELLPQYYQSFSAFFSEFFKKINLELIEISLPDYKSLISSAYAYLLSISDELANAGIGFLSDLITSVTNLSVALISGVYLLIFKERLIAGIKKTLFAFFPKEPTEHTIDLLRDSNRIFTNYLYSKILTSVLIGLLTFITMLIFGLPYSPLISVIMTVFNLIPFFGPFLGAVPSVLLLFLSSPSHALTFIIITLAVQFIDNQFLTPKIVGDSIGINPFWVLFSIVVGGSIGGILGMFFGVPVFAVIMAILRIMINKRLAKKGLSTDTADYHTFKVRK